MATAIICLILIAISIVTIRNYKKKLSGGCCGGSGEGKEKKVKVTDRDVSHYPLNEVVRVDGMTCGNCIRKVENALNRLDGVWAEGNLSDGTMKLRMKHETSDDEIRRVIREAGYCALSINK